MPPFTDEHEQLRETIAPLRRERDRARTSSEWEDARVSSPASSSPRAGRARLPRAQVPGGATAARAATTSTTPSGPRSSPRAGVRRRRRRASAPTSGSRRRRSGSSAPTTRSSASCVPAIRGERIAALGITEPGAGSDVAGDPHLRPQGRRRLRRQRLEDVHHQRRARRLPRLRREDDRGGRPPRACRS